ncbi:ribonuclease E/G [Sphingomonas sp. HITSZ_GF]|uniref:Rne/Rng family ribonuclease n=1 Tax=Sphingomonas sp. HITSZ_GF TaxID=3037247 RepID=UPI00240DE215|nr:ribonuclease E/G [Sphingomonas sp. HITSZ_GF]MDG2533297.1 ribonuclease E/G [Sphingomonas sp. HITSZ_GF]
MTMRMLIDARHREETRVAVVKGSRIEEFDFESAERKQLKGNIYLAKVTRVEPSLQAAFVDYGGNRHGFLAFSEIHPDYYQIPKEDRDALLREEAEHAAEEAALRAEEEGDEDHLDGDDGVEVLERPQDDEDEHDHDHEDAEGETSEGESEEGGRGRRRGKRRGSGGGEDSPAEALRQRRMNLRRRYKIQDVIRRRQVLLVQVVKEERGNKGAALTTYLSLAGRYCVLMPNTAHGGGISRKISSAADRKRLKTIMADLKLPPSMGCIVRTAGLQRTKTEIKRDFDYLARLWDGIRENTLKSTAPALVYGDSDLLKRAIRDIYNRDIDEVIVEGEDGYRQAKDFMKLLMPSHAKKVKQYADAVPLFQRAGVEDQLSAMYNPVVQLKSGGYLVINPTEALVSIDINSGRSTREHNIEQTATATNLEAAHEIARQLRLRDMAGLVVIDFIDMDHGSNVRKVEKAMKEALKNDRARIQVGRISAFGLMEMSRQRLRTGVLEASTVQCPHCEGTGLVRTASSAGLSALRLIEDEAARGRGSLITLRASQEAAFYVLNKKRADIAEIEDRYGVTVEILSDGELEGARMSVEASGPPPAHAPRFEKLIEEPEDDDYVEEIDEEEEEFEEEAEAGNRREGRRERDEGEGEGRGKRRRRRRGRGRGRREDGEAVEGEAEGGEEAEGEAAEGEEAPAAAEGEGEGRESGRKRRRRGRRGGRRGDRAEGGEDAVEGEDAPVSDVAEMAEAEAPAEPVAEEAPAKPKRSRKKKVEAVEAEAAPAVEAPVEAAPEPVAEEAPAKPKRSRAKKKPALSEVEGVEAVEAEAAPAIEAPAPEPVAAEAAPAKPKRTRKKAVTAEAAPAPAVAEAAPVAQDVTLEEGAEADEDGDGPRRGWWQRTFGA